MDCKTARSLLDFARPQCAELDAGEADALESHLNGCPECDALFRQERRIDDHLGRAVRDVPVPQGLRTLILDRLSSERRKWLRGLVLRGAGLASAAALLIALGVWGFQTWLRPALFDVELEQVHHDRIDQEVDQDRIVEWFKNNRGEDVVLPQGFNGRPLNYGLLSDHYDVMPFVGNQTAPMIRFVACDKQPPPDLRVYLLSPAKFDLKALAARPPRGSQGYRVEVRVLFDPAGTPTFGYVLVYPEKEGLKPFLIGVGGAG